MPGSRLCLVEREEIRAGLESLQDIGRSRQRSDVGSVGGCEPPSPAPPSPVLPPPSGRGRVPTLRAVGEIMLSPVHPPQVEGD